MKIWLTLPLFLVVPVNLEAQSGYYRDDYGRSYYRDSSGSRYYLSNAYSDRYGYRYYIDRNGQRHYLYEGDFEGPLNYETRKIDFDIGRIGALGRNETAAIFKTIWGEFRKKFSLNDKGIFEEFSGSTTPDNEQTQAAFLRYVAEQTPEVTIPFKEKCSRCDGEGFKVGLVNYGSSQIAAQKRCDACNGTGGSRGVIIYRLVYTARQITAPTVVKVDTLPKSNQVLAEQGDAKAQFLMGEFFWKQEGKEEDIDVTTALKWYRASLLGGNLAAAERLIEIHVQEHATLKQDLPFARALQKLYTTNSTLNDKLLILLSSKSVLEDIESAALADRIVFLRSSIDAVISAQCLDPKVVRLSLSIEQPDIQARCKAGDASALYRLGLFYATGLGKTTRNPELAAFWLEQAACKGNPDAFYVLGALYESNVLNSQNLTAAHALYTVSAKLFSPQWSPWERIAALTTKIDLEASTSASNNIMELLKSQQLTVDNIKDLSKLKVPSFTPVLINEGESPNR